MSATERRLSRRDLLKGLAAIGVVGVGGPIMYSPQILGATDALQNRVHADLRIFTNWLKREGVRGYIGEMNWPNDEKRGFGDEARWNALGEKWYRWADVSGLWVTMHNVDEYQRWGGFWLCAYVSAGDGEARPISRPLAQASVYERHPSTSRYRRGMQVSSAQRWEDRWSNRNPGEHGRDYWYPSSETFDYLQSRGTDIVRLPFRWERIQPALGGALDRAELSRLRGCVRRADAAGLKVVLSLQNFGLYYVEDTGGARPIQLGNPDLPPVFLVDVWRRLSSQFRTDRAVLAYDLMNEPYTGEGIDGSGYPSRQRAWEAMSQRVVEAIRGVGDRKLLMIPGYAHIHRWAEAHPRRWIRDPTSNHMYTAHHYFDDFRGTGTGGGNYHSSYDDEVAYSQERGY